LKYTLLLLLVSFLSASSYDYLTDLQNKNIAVVANQASIIQNKHLVDFLLENNVTVRTIFTPEHGFRGGDDAGAYVQNSVDVKTGLPIISLYGKNKKPSKSSLKNIDIVIFDLQDVGVRFYTYLSTLHYVMEAVAESHKSMILLDRPNPNIHYIDGPILEKGFSSFVGLHPVPLVYGMTIGEYAQMINGEGWLKNSLKANLNVVRLKNYTHKSRYTLPVKPSPNLPTQNSILLYPSLALLEGTPYSLGRGTSHPFECYGDILYPDQSFSFTPKAMQGAKYPKYKNRKVYGKNLQNIDGFKKKLNLSYLLDAYKNYPNKQKFFLKNLFFDKLAGTDKLRLQLIKGVSEKNIRKSWKTDIDKFKKMRENYLLYP
jgi:uncharacterized protein YbbC (DUF1343 family)